jgi:hypothetical protein
MNKFKELQDLFLKMKRPHLRVGQTYFNCLTYVDSDLAEEIRGTEIDPFYNDNLEPFFLKLEERWGRC